MLRCGGERRKVVVSLVVLALLLKGQTCCRAACALAISLRNERVVSDGGRHCTLDHADDMHSIEAHSGCRFQRGDEYAVPD